MLWPNAGSSPTSSSGTSVGAINGAFFAADPTLAGVERLTELWRTANLADRSPGTVLRRVTTLARTGTHLQSLTEMRDRLRAVLPVDRVEELSMPFQCVAASIERAAEHWFDSGPLAEVVLASCAVPGILPPVRIDGEHFIDGGIVNSIPVSRAVTLGASKIYVLQVGRLEQSLEPPRWPWEVGLVAFEVARRHRFAHDLHSLPDDVDFHVLPTGGSAAPAYNDLSGQLRVGRIARTVERQIDSAYEASRQYLARRLMPPVSVRRPVTVVVWLVVSSWRARLSAAARARQASQRATRRRQALIVTRLIIAYFGYELAALVGCGALWLGAGCGLLIRTRRSRRSTGGCCAGSSAGSPPSGRADARIDVDPELSTEAAIALESDRPLIVLSRHAGPGDTIFIVDQLMSQFRRRPSVVFKESLALDPASTCSHIGSRTRCSTAPIVRRARRSSSGSPPSSGREGHCCCSPKAATSRRSAGAPRCCDCAGEARSSRPSRPRA